MVSFFFPFSKRPIWPSFKSCFCFFSQNLSLIWSTGFHWIPPLGPWRFRSYNHLAKWPEPYIRIQSHQNLPVFNGGALEVLWGWPHAPGIWYLIGDWVTICKAGKTAAAKPFGTGGSLMDLSSICMNLFCLLKVHSLYFHVSRQLAQRQCSEHWRLGYPKFVTSQL